MEWQGLVFLPIICVSRLETVCQGKCRIEHALEDIRNCSRSVMQSNTINLAPNEISRTNFLHVFVVLHSDAPNPSYFAQVSVSVRLQDTGDRSGAPR